MVVDGFWAMEIDPTHEADSYIDDVKRSIGDSAPPRLIDEVNKQIDAARVSPGAEEAALFDRFSRIIESATSQYDRIVFDTAPTGQTLRLLSLPELMTAWITGLVSNRKKVNALGRMWRNVAGAAAGDVSAEEDPVLAALEDRRSRFQRARRILTDARRAAFVFVVVPERLPILETQRAVAVLSKYGIPIEGVFVNRVLPPDAAGRFLERRRIRESQYLRMAEDALSEYSLHRIPLLEEDVVGVAALRRLLSISEG
jgi:arsenite-transporting ATPase